MKQHPNQADGRRADLLVDIAILLGVVAICRAIALIAGFARESMFVDLGVYRMGGQALLDGVPLYELHYEVAGLPFTYTPFAAIVFAPWALLSRDPAVVLWSAVSCLALLRACWLVARETKRRTGGSWPVALLAFVLFISALQLEPVLATLGFGQVNLLIMWLILEDVLRRRPNPASGALLGIATGIKLVPGLFIVFLFLTKRTREGIVASIVTLGTVALGFAFQPAEAWKYWTGIAYDPSRVGGVAYISNQSLNGVITRFTQPGGSKLAWAVLSVGVVSLCLWAGRRLWAHDLKLLAVSSVALGTLLVSPISWSHHWVWLVVVLAALLDPAAGPKLVRWIALAVTFAAAASYVIWSVPNTDDQEYDHTIWERLIGNSYTWVAIALLALITWVAVTADRREPETAHRIAEPATEPQPTVATA